MKKIIAIFALVLTTSITYAQSINENYKTKAQSEINYIKKTKELTKDQEEKLFKVYYKLQETLNNGSITKEVKDALVKELKEKEAKILAEKK